MTSSFGYSLRAGVVQYQISLRSDKMQKLPFSLRILYGKEWHVRSLESPPIQIHGQLPRLLSGKSSELCCCETLSHPPGLYRRQPRHSSRFTFTVSSGTVFWSAHSCSGEIWDLLWKQICLWALFKGEIALNNGLHSLCSAPAVFIASRKMCVLKRFSFLSHCYSTVL